MQPLNVLIKNSTKFPGGFTYKRENLNSQNDRIIVSKSFIDHVTDCKLLDSLSNLPDHIPIQAKIEFKAGEILDQVSKSIDDIK